MVAMMNGLREEASMVTTLRRSNYHNKTSINLSLPIPNRKKLENHIENNNGRYYKRLQRRNDTNLHLRVRELLKQDKPDKATQTILNSIYQNTNNDKRFRNSIESICKTARLFKTFERPERSIEIYRAIDRNFPLTREGIVSVIQSCDQLIWKDNSSSSNFESSTPDGCYKIEEAYHQTLSHHLNDLIRSSKSAAEPPSSSSKVLKADLKGKQKEENRDEEYENENELFDGEGDDRAFEVILSTILKLGDSDWLVRSMRDRYPRFMDRLGQMIYPDYNHDFNSNYDYRSKTREIIENENHESEDFGIDDFKKDELPTGRVLKYLVSCFTKSDEFEKALKIIKVYQSIVLRKNRPDRDFRDLSPQITFLRDLSRSKSMEANQTKKKFMLKEILKFFMNPISSKPDKNGKFQKSVSMLAKIELDCYKFEGLIDVRYRLRSSWDLIKNKNTSCFKLINLCWMEQLRIFLIHHRSSKIHKNNNDVINQRNKECLGLVSGSRLSSDLSMSWRYRPSSRCFTLILLSLLTDVRSQTRTFNLQIGLFQEGKGKDEGADHFKDQSNYRLVRTINGNRPLKRMRRPSPGTHRRLIAQMFALQALNCSIFNKNRSNIRNDTKFDSSQSSSSSSPWANEGDWSYDDDWTRYFDLLPKHFKLLNPKNLNLMLEIFWVSRDYAGLSELIHQLNKFEPIYRPSNEGEDGEESGFDDDQHHHDKNRFIKLGIKKFIIETLNKQSIPRRSEFKRFEQEGNEYRETVKETVSDDPNSEEDTKSETVENNYEEVMEDFRTFLKDCEIMAGDSIRSIAENASSSDGYDFCEITKEKKFKEWWLNEVNCFRNHLRFEDLKINSFYQIDRIKFSEVTNKFLRNRFSRNQLEYLCFGLFD